MKTYNETCKKAMIDCVEYALRDSSVKGLSFFICFGAHKRDGKSFGDDINTTQMRFHPTFFRAMRFEKDGFSFEVLRTALADVEYFTIPYSSILGFMDSLSDIQFFPHVFDSHFHWSFALEGHKKI